MKILVLADEESKLYWDHYKKGMFDGVDLIISAGDLKSEYLTYMVSLANVPLLYVHGNHDENYAVKPPEGCECIDDQIYVHDGIRILGLGGSMRYRKGEWQYTEKAMKWRIQKLKLKLAIYGGFDILVTHAPLAGFHDGDDLCHKGFEAFRELLEKYQPKYFIHGHMHMNYGARAPRLSVYENTVVINAYDHYDFEYGDAALLEKAQHAKSVRK